MTEAKDKSPEAYAKRLQQIIKNREKATDFLYAVEKGKQEEILTIIFAQSDWMAQLSLAETEAFLKTLKSVLGNFEYVQYFPKAELSRRCV